MTDHSELRDIVYHANEYEHNPSFSFENQSALKEAIDDYRHAKEAEREERKAQKRKAVNMGTSASKKRGKGSRIAAAIR